MWSCWMSETQGRGSVLPYASGKLRVGFYYATSLFKKKTIKKLSNQLKQILIAIAEGKKEEIDCQNFIKENIRQDKKTEFNIKKILKYFKELEKTIK